MTLSLRLRSGTYKPMAAESTPPRTGKVIKCSVRLLDDSQQLIEIEKSATGQTLLDRLFDCLDLSERDYFGLQLLDPLQELPGVVRWIEPDKKIRKQFKSEGIFLFLFRIKFYAPDPCRLHEEYTRYHFFMQLKLDIAERRLWCSEESAILLASYAVQSELGDYNPADHMEGYTAEFKYFASSCDPQPVMFEQRVAELHKQHRGQSPADAEFNFLYNARNLETYGVVVFEVLSFPPSPNEEASNEPYTPEERVHVGVSASGVAVFRGCRRVLTYPWCNICKVSFKSRNFHISIVKETTAPLHSSKSLTNGGSSSGKGGLERFHQGRGQHASNGDGPLMDGPREFMQHVSFTLKNAKLARSLWQTAVEYHTFFRLKTPLSTSKSTSLLAPFNLSFRYSGRTEFQGIEDMKRKMRTVERPFSRASFNRYARRTINSAVSSQTPSMLQHQTIPQKLHSQGQNGSVFSRQNNFAARNGSNNTASPGSSAVTSGSSWLGRSSFSFGIVSMLPAKNAPVNAISSASAVNHSRTFSTPASSLSPGLQKNLNGVHDNATPRSPSLGVTRNTSNKQSTAIGSTLQNVNMNSLLGIPERLEDLPFYEDPQSTPTASGVFNQQHQLQPQPQQSRLNGNAFHSNNVSSARSMGGASSSVTQHSISSTTATNLSVPLVTIRLRPDAEGRFGFNVKGGLDQQMAVVVSRVAPNTPADRAIPRLREGDLILSINGRDPNAMLHDEVVSAIRTSREEGSGELVLVVRPQLQVPGLDLQAMSPTHNRNNTFLNSRSAAAVTGNNDTGVAASTPPGYRSSAAIQQQSEFYHEHLHVSIQEMREALSPGTGNSIVSRFEKLERRNASMIVSVATHTENLPKNRYRDITPYDETRVKIKNRPHGDYINASHVNMEIPGAGVVNRYICCQGPLPNTCADFWQMAWEQQSTLVVMLTAQMEQGMIKCHQYWPNVNETCKYDGLQVSCLRESSHDGLAERQLSLINLQTSEERHVTQLQYMAWPDHGVPEEPCSFIEFVQRVRSLRAGTVEPTVVHCSAGIGRTGVILLVETAMSMIEAGQKVDPIDIVRRLRCQRAMLVQNASQFVFACQAILTIFDDKIVTPAVGENGTTDVAASADNNNIKKYVRR